eukprot:TRINITY_DN229904_c0_g1_i1.p1 TRINITY_DN229904_c0_g1~~TRINITY_DN229904_c0_g1_i1.p1  ORF type:complete len:334 (-),score=42.96 TRINITY_DN229904_c0_g1_i1:176-1123(-)
MKIHSKGDNILLAVSLIATFLKFLFGGIFRIVQKIFYHLITGKCEAVRIVCASRTHTSHMTRQFWNCIKSSSQLKSIKTEIEESPRFNIEEMIEKIVDIKKVKTIDNEWVRFGHDNMRACLGKMFEANTTIQETVLQTQISFNHEFTDHQTLLLELWRGFFDENIPNVVGEHWKLLGFQGKDPATDFRGMGILGLRHLVYFVNQNKERALHELERSRFPHGLPLCITGINVSDFVVKLMKTRYLDHCLIHPSFVGGSERFFVLLMADFCDFWYSKPRHSIMDFGPVFAEFRANVTDNLTTETDDFAQRLGLRFHA